MTIENPGVHVHRTRLVDGQPICQDCRQVVVVPILSHNDPRLQESLAGQPADLQVIEICDRAGVERPDYILQLMAKYNDAGDPPHTGWGQDVIDWWATQ